MKLTARKTMVALGTAVAVSLAPVTGSVVAPTAFAAITYSDGQVEDAYTQAKGAIGSAQEKLDSLKKSIAGREYSSSDAQLKLDEAKSEIAQAEVYVPSMTQIEAYAKFSGTSEENKSAIDALNGYKKAGSEASLHLTKAQTALTAAENAQKKADNDKFECLGAVNANTGAKGEEGSSEGMSSDLTSSGSRIVIKDGKKKCISNFEYYSDKLTKLVAVLGTLFTLVTTVTKISSQFQKLAPVA